MSQLGSPDCLPQFVLCFGSWDDYGEIFYFQFSQICGSIIFHIVVRSGQIFLLWCVSIYSLPARWQHPEVIRSIVQRWLCHRSGAEVTRRLGQLWPMMSKIGPDRCPISGDVFSSHPVNIAWLPPFPSRGRWTNSIAIYRRSGFPKWLMTLMASWYCP